MYRRSSCSVCIELKISCVRYGDVRASGELASGFSGRVAISASRSGLPFPVKASTSFSSSACECVSSNATATSPPPIARTLILAAAHRSTTAAAASSLPHPTLTVSKIPSSFGTAMPSFATAAANSLANVLQRVAMSLSPLGPWYSAYIAEMLASSACAVQMLLVALSRRMCCSRVCIAIRNAGLPCASRDTPMMRPGMLRLYSSRVAKNAACGPP
mmetsp:Transcript_17567/g.44706  ORF Transcript_17567/g.44706 Transcript_17567/m.44706 type:complete len:216 (+) Transcript_17567:2201-2848(+)